MLTFPISLQAADIHARYIELLTRSGDYYRFLSEMLKSLEDLKVSLYLSVMQNRQVASGRNSFA